MGKVVEKFGEIVQKECEKNPAAARQLLLAGYRAKRLQVRTSAGESGNRAVQKASLVTFDSMIAPLAHPERSAIVSLFTPCEMLQVAGLHPYSCEGFGCYLSGTHAERMFLQYAENEGLPETFCSYHKVFIGAAEKGLMPKPRFIINTTLACDANLLTFRRLAEHYEVDQYVLDIPYGQDEAAVDYVTEQLHGMKEFIENHTGEKIDEGKLAKAVARSQRSMDNYNKYMTLRADKQIMETVTDHMYEAFTLHNLLGTEQTEDFTIQSLKTVKAAPAAAGKRLIWMHTIPYWVHPLRDALDNNPAVQVVGCDMCFEGLVQADKNDPYRAMAQRIVYSAFNGPVSRRIDRGLEVARQTKADGVIWFCHWGCKHTLGGAQLAKQRFEEAGYPCLILDGDGCDRSHGGEGQLATRLEAFIEMLEGEQA
jgi:benzoyl-CoA reductase/2-hydroxyglutaryl-CoA dehydratase subunit BcrC/BadD/HgdB